MLGDPTVARVERPVVDATSVDVQWNTAGELEVSPGPGGPWKRVSADSANTTTRTRLPLDLSGNRFFRIVDNGIPGAAQPLVEGDPRRPFKVKVAFLRKAIESNGGNAALEVMFEPGQNVARQVPLLINGEVVVLNDIGTGADLKADDGFHSGFVVVDLAELKEANEFIAKLPIDVRKRTVFKGRELVGVEEVKALDTVGFEKGESIQVFPSPFGGGGIQIGQLSQKARLSGLTQLDPLASLDAITKTNIGNPGSIDPPIDRPTDPVSTNILFIPPPVAGGNVFRKSLLITDLSVVEDPSRTWDPCVPDKGTRMGAWTFGRLITDMCNQPKSGIHPSDFARRWLRSWQVDQVVNFDTATNRNPEILGQVIKDWEAASGGPDKPLDLSIAPFRLLAIVNRVDLRGNPGYGGVSGEDPCNPPCIGGEARFVFGVVPGLRNNSGGGGGYPGNDPIHTNRVEGACGELPFTVILEYCVPKNTCDAIRNWGLQWYTLSTLPFGSAFNEALEKITDQFATAGADPRRKPNESALSQLRANELLRDPWELREWRLFPNDSDVGHLREVTVKQTPDFDLNFSKLIVEYCNTFAADIIGGSHVVPLQFGTPKVPFLGSVAPMPAKNFFWDGPPPQGTTIPTKIRHPFSLATCNGCHAGETGTPFTHVFTRLHNQEANLSDFLTGAAMPKLDPADGVTPHTFADLKRREQDLLELISTPCFFQFFHDPVAFKH